MESTPEDRELVDRAIIRRILVDFDVPAIGFDADATFERLLRALDDQRGRRRRRWLLLAASIAIAVIVAGVMTLLLRLEHVGVPVARAP